MEITKSKRKCVCKKCLKPITKKYKVIYNNKTYHLSCFHNHLIRTLEIYKKYLKQFSKVKFKKQMILESL